jgi:hypothetical protein
MHWNVFICMLSISLSLALLTPALSPQTARQQIATLPIQLPPKEHFSLLDIDLKQHIEHRGQA